MDTLTTHLVFRWLCQLKQKQHKLSKALKLILHRSQLILCILTL